MASQKLIIRLLRVLLWVLSIHAGTFGTATLLPRPITGLSRSSLLHHKGIETLHLDRLPQPDDINMKIPEKDLNQSVIFGSGIINHLHRLETNLGWSNIHVKKDSPSHGQLIESAPEKESMKQGRQALIAIKATIHLMNLHCNKYNLSPAECSKYISNYNLKSTPLHGSCTNLLKTCSSQEVEAKYRSIDGSCNHIVEGSRGESFTSYKRLIFADYLDGVQEPRRSVKKKNLLPSPRVISNAVTKNDDITDKEFTLAVMQWSQFVGHDLAHTASSKMVHSDNTIACCGSDGSNLSPRYIHPFCAPISVPGDDHFYSKYSLECMPYVRSIPALRTDCSFGPLEQINQATHFLDGSQIYGSDDKRAADLRSYYDGQLEVSKKDGHMFLPISDNPTTDCQVNSNGAPCFVSGDSRVNLQPQLTVMHTLWHREHNRIAKELALLNRRWDDEHLYQEARRIVIAEMQHITYNEWLPLILGKKYTSKIQNYGAYQENIDPSISNSFSTAALRFINSLMGDKLRLYQENRSVNLSLSLREHFNRPITVEKPGHFDALIRGLATQNSQRLDMDYVKDVTSQLFYNGNYGYDILSLDIQRGRDHGLPSYIAFRTLCGLDKADKFEDFLDVMSPQAVKSLSDVYHHPHDVDLLVGGMSEKPDGNSLLGPTFSCIIADQFLRTKRGDRYFYTNTDQPQPFSDSQLKEIKKVTLARLFCDNGEDIQRMQLNVFKQLNDRNVLLNCNSVEIPHINLKYWKDDQRRFF